MSGVGCPMSDEFGKWMIEVEPKPYFIIHHSAFDIRNSF